MRFVCLIVALFIALVTWVAITPQPEDWHRQRRRRGEDY